MIGMLLKKFRLFPRFIFTVAKDFVKYIINRDYKKFQGWGLHIYLGMFGMGKTCSMVYDAYNIACKYEGLTIITNLKLQNFPEHCKILPLRSAQDILNAPDNTLVLIDEIGTIFNSRDFAKSKESVPKLLFQHICQCRHRHLMIMGTVQRWGFLDKQLRDITADVTVCKTSFRHPFSRMVTNTVYDAYEYDLFCSNPLRPIMALSADCYIQTDKIRALYDTKEMVDTLLTMEYISDKEILENRGEAPSVVALAEQGNKKKSRLSTKQKVGY